MPRHPVQPPPRDADDAGELLLVRAIQRDGPANTAAWTALLSAYQHRLYAVCLRMVNDRDAAADLTQDTFVKIIQGLPGYDGRSKLSTWMIRVAMNTCLSYLRAQKHRRHASLSSLLDSYGEPTSLPTRPASPGPGPRPTPNKPASAAQSPQTPPKEPNSASLDLQSIEPPSQPHNEAGSLSVFTGPGGAGRTSDWREQTREQTPEEGVQLSERRRLVAVAMNALPPDQRAILVLRDVQDLDYDQIAQTMDLAVGTVKSRLFRARLALREAIERAESELGRANRAAPGSMRTTQLESTTPDILT